MQTKYKVARALSDRINVEVSNANQTRQLPIDNYVNIETKLLSYDSYLPSRLISYLSCKMCSKLYIKT